MARTIPNEDGLVSVGEAQWDIGFLRDRSQMKRITSLSSTVSCALRRPNGARGRRPLHAQRPHPPAGHQLGIGRSSKFAAGSLVPTPW